MALALGPRLALFGAALLEFALLAQGAAGAATRSPHERGDLRDRGPGCRFAPPGYTGLTGLLGLQNKQQLLIGALNTLVAAETAEFEVAIFEYIYLEPFTDQGDREPNRVRPRSFDEEVKT
ncbi:MULTISPECIES: hypothetical protein [unclassified Bradyrhizobium]|nr:MULTISPECIES: hypothetical protein [unclassified Bradyrhizobium]